MGDLTPFVFHLPTSVPIGGKKKFALNMNEYRNAHFHVLNKAKQNFTKMSEGALKELPRMTFIVLEYRLYLGTKRKADLSNICSIVDKFFCDALTTHGVIPDDNIDHLRDIRYRFMGVDPKNQRVEIIISDYKLANTEDT